MIYNGKTYSISMKKDKILINILTTVILLLICFLTTYALNRNDDTCQTTLNTNINVPLPIIYSNTDNEVIAHSYYVLSYNETHEQPNWVMYMITKKHVEGAIQRESAFTEDKDVTTKSAKSADYHRSGYDRGHICPAADMRLNMISMKESFYMSNISPQKHQFNAGIWLDLENHVRSLVKEHDTLYVVAGPVLKPGLPKIKGTYNEISIPESFFKIIYSKKEGWMSGYLISHSVNYKNKKPLKEYAVSVDSIEKITEIDFFSKMPNENELERSIVAY